MSAGNVTQLVVSNNGFIDASIFLIVGPMGAIYALNPPVYVGDVDIVLDLTKVEGLTNGDEFTVRAVSGQGEQANNTVVLTYTRNTTDTGHYTVTDTAVAPGLSFQGIRPTLR
ncbi:hypothetical protein GYMLUDRAFT_248399 [Collybiopsis luxurians FD-317 M1]|uniref:Uncharacterized protein n=1 Tax=Collybiopsis luxurians FD-317 M1 TaxID=944289 RepID=A0A0D0AYM9_9AGAR|nr:hypothetical protein GYMLUDRAFT_248399 [Collybiopsis luxurians FD-317 M1]